MTRSFCNHCRISATVKFRISSSFKERRIRWVIRLRRRSFSAKVRNLCSLSAFACRDCCNSAVRCCTNDSNSWVNCAWVMAIPTWLANCCIKLISNACHCRGASHWCVISKPHNWFSWGTWGLRLCQMETIRFAFTPHESSNCTTDSGNPKAESWISAIALTCPWWYNSG